jgi:hypothetical protein
MTKAALPFLFDTGVRAGDGVGFELTQRRGYAHTCARAFIFGDVCRH